MARRDELLEALDAIEMWVCQGQGESRDIWLDELVYALCQAVRMRMRLTGGDVKHDSKHTV